jgi:hypothetical protein
MNLARNYYEVVETNYQGYIAVMWGTTTSVLLFLVSVASHKASEESAKSLPLVHSLLVSLDLRRDLVADRNSLCTQLTNLKIEFTACGIFTVNLQFLFSILGVTCTNVIVLCQLN